MSRWNEKGCFKNLSQHCKHTIGYFRKPIFLTNNTDAGEKHKLIN